MRCPKCHYISFERCERCRNCGYDFSLAVDIADPELPIRGVGPEEHAIGPMADLALDDLGAALTGDAPAPLPDDTFNLHRVTGSRLELPLFGGPDANRPLGAPTPAPRAPLAVRRSSTPDPVRSRAPKTELSRRHAAAAGAPRLGFEPTADADAVGAGHGAAGPVARREPGASGRPQISAVPAGAGRRLAAGTIDLAILLSIDLAVLYFTLRLCGLGFADVLIIPPVPFVGFLLLLNGGYATAFTAASGQTIGKMASGIRVIGAPGSEAAAQGRIGFGFAVLRTVAYLASVLPAGLGLLPAFVGRERRALHDRLAETRVIRVSAIG